MLDKKYLLKVFLFWLLPASIITLVMGSIYASVQQNYRQSANDPQIQMAEDGARALSSGALPSLLVGSQSVDAAKSLAPFMVIYSDMGRPIESGVTLLGQTPVPPAGVFIYVKEHGQDRLTWEPEKGVRIAAVVTRFSGNINGSGFVLAGRSLREVENRERSLTQMIFMIWILCLIISFTGVYFVVTKILKPIIIL